MNKRTTPQEIDVAWETMPLLKAISQINNAIEALVCEWKLTRTPEEEAIIQTLRDAQQTVRREHEARQQGGAK